MIERIKQSLLSNTLIYRMFQNLLIPDDYTVIYKKLSELIKKNFMDYTVYDLGCGDAPFAKYLDKEINEWKSSQMLSGRKLQYLWLHLFAQE